MAKPKLNLRDTHDRRREPVCTRHPQTPMHPVHCTLPQHANKQTNKHYKKIIMLTWFPIYLFLINFPPLIYIQGLNVFGVQLEAAPQPPGIHIDRVWNVWLGVKVPSSGSGHSPDTTPKKAHHKVTPPQGESGTVSGLLVFQSPPCFRGGGEGEHGIH